MEEINKDGSEVLETTEETTTEETDVDKDNETKSTETSTDEEKESLRLENEELKKKNSQLFERAKKAEKAETSKDGLSPRDAILIAKSNIDDEDVDEVLDFAKYRKIPVGEALKNQTLQSILRDRVEERKTATAAQTRSARGTSQVSSDVILSRAQKGEIPDKETDIEKLAAARMESRIKR